jgi:hypothetical protein
MPTISAPVPEQRRQLRPNLSEIAALVGGDDPARHTAILATGATFAEIEHALALATGADEALGRTSHPLEGPAALVYEILTADEPDDDGP